MMFSIFSPIEQFRCLPIVVVDIGGYPITVFSNVTVMFALIFLFLGLLFYYTFKHKSRIFSLIPTRFQLILESSYLLVDGLIKANVGAEGRPFFPYIFSFFFFICCANIIGLVPYSYTLTSHIIITFSLAVCLFIGASLINWKKHRTSMAQSFLPSGSEIFLALLLVPIELVSFLFRPISLSIRLFANMMAGHALLKVIAQFGWAMVYNTEFQIILEMFPLLFLFLLYFLEFGVALIQAYVFTILICIYINDAINLH